MLPLQSIRNNKDKIILRLSKRNFKNTKIIERIISLDETCRKIQVELDNELSNANNINKQIGLLFKNKKHLEVSELKEKSIIIKSKAKELQNELKQNREKLNFLVEPACATSLAACLGPLKHKIVKKNVALIACGSNISFERYKEIVS